VLSADRGIGGTGIAQTFADQGIGGTGIGSGIGGTGGPGIQLRGLPAGGPAGATAIVGTITGFAGLCIDGVALAVNRPVRMTVDGEPRQSEVLHRGQVAAIEARGGPDALYAVSVAVRHEVSGPVTAAPSAGVLDVAGQRVAIGPQTVSAGGMHVGDWVAVSGLRDLTGTIQASRIDRREPGDMLVSGRPKRVGDTWMLGGLAIQFPPGQAPGGEGRVLLGGAFDHGMLRVTTVSDDPVVPAVGAARRIVLRSFAAVDGAAVHLTSGLRAAIGPGFGDRPPADRPVIVQLTVADDGTLIALSWRPAEPP
jgi:hypothetical protein